MRLKDKVAFITGATGGMGSAEGRLFAEEGASVVVAARKEDLGRKLVKEITDDGGEALFVKLDVTNQEQWTGAVQQTKDEFGALHVLVNNAGVNTAAVIPYVDLEVWNDVLATNVTGPLMGIQACAPLMRESGGGSIINIGSIGGLTANFSAAYASSKWALRGLSGSAAFCLADWGIRCNIIEPGFIKTNMTQNMPMERVNDVVLLRRPGDADEIAKAALFLASDESSYTTGAEILVDGGFYAPGPYLVAERGMGFLAKLQEAMEPADDTESDQSAGVIDNSLEGTYKATISSPLGKQEVIFDYHVEGAALTGTVTVAGNSAEVEAGKATDDGFAHQFRMKTPMGRIRVQVTGRVEGDKILGDIKTPVGSVHFEGTRV